MQKRVAKVLLALGIAGILAVPTISQAGLVGPFVPTASELVATGGEVIVYFAGQAAAFDSVLNVVGPCCIGPFFPNHATPVGTPMSLGIHPAGTELKIRLDVLTTGNSFFTGPGSGNPDGLVHVAHGPWAADGTIPAAGILVGFEDILGGGDKDYDDNTFVFTNVRTGGAVPGPASLLLIGSGLLGLAALRRVKAL